MKNFLLFIVAMFIGATIFIGGVNIIKKKTPPPSPTPIQKEPLFSIDTPPPSSQQGTILSYSGDVKWQSRSATEPATLVTIVPVAQGETVATGDNGKISIKFPTTVMDISQKTTIDFSQTLPVSFVVNQHSGTVVYNHTDTSPFAVRSFHLLTQFNNSSITETVDDEQHFITIDVTKGEVTVAYNNKHDVSTIETIKEGQRFTFDDDARESDIEKLK